MTAEPALRVLVVENDPGAVRLLQEILSVDGSFSQLGQAGSLARALERLAREAWEVILLGLELPDSRGLEALEKVREKAPHLPILVIGGRSDKRLGAAALRAGAQDYLVKGRLGEGLLAQAVRHAVERNRAGIKLREAEERYRNLFEEAPVMYVTTESARKAVVTDCSRLFAERLGYTRSEVLGRPLSDFYADPWPSDSGERKLIARDGSILETLFRAVSETDAWGVESEARVTFLDVTERKRAQNAFRGSEVENRALIDAIPDLILRIRQDGTCFEMKTAKKFEPLAPEREAIGHSLFEVLPRALAESSLLATRLALESRSTQVMDYELPEGGRMRHYEARLVPCGDQEVVATVRDVSGRKEIEERLRQSQRMEAVGRVADGLAHDFNNILTAITGYSELLLADLTSDDPKRPSLNEIRKNADRAGDLTRRLVAFSRRQVLRPHVVHLNRIVGDVLTLLRRVIAENIELTTCFDPSVGCVEADPAELEQIVLNLALNARDAMPEGGTLRIETKPVEVDDSNVWLHPKVRLGSYALLSISDSRPGNAGAHRPKVFESLSTTEARRGETGLGLAAVHGIVEQSAGFICVCREPGTGISVNVYLPRRRAENGTDREPGKQIEEMNRRRSGTGSETILLVEDDQTVRALARRVLCDHGYRVIEAEDGLEGVRLCSQVKGSIDLIVTDVVMPNASGPRMAERLHGLHPRIKLLYMSGYSENRLVMQTIDSGVPFLRKPFSATGLARKVRDVLDS